VIDAFADVDLLGFLVVVVVVAVTPGPDMVLVGHHALVGGRRAGLATALGVNCGLVVHAVVAAVGLSAVLAASRTAFTGIRVAGALYLVVIGVRALVAALRGRVDRDGTATGPARTRRPFREGLTTNVLNPQVAIVYLSLLPQFVDPDGTVWLQSVVLGAVYLGVGLSWLGLYVLVLSTGPAQQWMAGTVRRLVDGVAGTVLAGFGLLVAIDR